MRARWVFNQKLLPVQGTMHIKTNFHLNYNLNKCMRRTHSMCVFFSALKSFSLSLSLVITHASVYVSHADVIKMYNNSVFDFATISSLATTTATTTSFVLHRCCCLILCWTFDCSFNSILGAFFTKKLLRQQMKTTRLTKNKSLYFFFVLFFFISIHS